MGADLLLHHVWIRHGQAPDWAAAKAVIAGMTDAETEALESIEYTEVPTPALYRDSLLNDLEDVIDVWQNDRRVAYRTQIGPVDVLLTGGVSWGDEPTDEFRVIGRLLETQAFETAGFFAWPTCAAVDCSGMVLTAGSVYCDDCNGRVPMAVG